MDTHFAVHVYGDSLSLPRWSDGVADYDTYPELLRERIEKEYGLRVSVCNRSQGGGHVAGLLASFVNDGAYFGGDGGRVLIIQTGIVDCAPRPIPMEARNLIARLPVPMRWAVAKLLHFLRPWLLRYGKSWRQSTPEAFQSQLMEWLRRASRAYDYVYVFNIAPTVPAIEAHSPGLHASIVTFNETIDAAVRRASYVNVKLIDVYDAISKDDRGVPSLVNEKDGHHITRQGHALYADLVWTSERARLADLRRQEPAWHAVSRS